MHDLDRNLTEADCTHLRELADMLEAMYDAGWQPDAATRVRLREFHAELREGFPIVPWQGREAVR